MERFAFAGVMIGGFGVWFSGVLLISLSLLVFVMIKRRNFIFKDDFKYYYFLTVIFASVIINPYAYIARYNPQYYLLPFIILLLCKVYFKENKFYIKSLTAVLVINSLLICGYTYYNFVVTNTIKTQLKTIKASKKTIDINWGNHQSKKLLFDEYEIPYNQVDSFRSGLGTDTLFRSEVVYKYQ